MIDCARKVKCLISQGVKPRRGGPAGVGRQSRRLHYTAAPRRAGAGMAFVLRETATSLAGPRNVSGLEKFFERFSAEARDHLRVGYAFDAPEFLETEEARAVAHERGPVELEHHATFFGGETGVVQRRFGVVFEDRPVLRGGEAVEETVEPQRLGARGEVEEVGALEFFGALELGVHRKNGFFAEFTLERSEGLRMTNLDSGTRMVAPHFACRP